VNVWTTGFTASIGMLWTRSWRKIYLANSVKRISPKRESGSREIGKTAFGIKKQENTTENTHTRKTTTTTNQNSTRNSPPSTPSSSSLLLGRMMMTTPPKLLRSSLKKLKLSYDQSKTVQFYLDQDGKGYVLEKVRITRSKDLRNAGGFFNRSLEKTTESRSLIQSRLLLLRRNELSRSLRGHQRRTKNAPKPVQSCENLSERFGHPAETFFYGVTT
jgi:hypothetical protein